MVCAQRLALLHVLYNTRATNYHQGSTPARAQRARSKRGNGQRHNKQSTTQHGTDRARSSLEPTHPPPRHPPSTPSTLPPIAGPLATHLPDAPISLPHGLAPPVLRTPVLRTPPTIGPQTVSQCGRPRTVTHPVQPVALPNSPTTPPPRDTAPTHPLSCSPAASYTPLPCSPPASQPHGLSPPRVPSTPYASGRRSLNTPHPARCSLQVSRSTSAVTKPSTGWGAWPGQPPASSAGSTPTWGDESATHIARITARCLCSFLRTCKGLDGAWSAAVRQLVLVRPIPGATTHTAVDVPKND